jgi:CheY-like chemotaxis protein
MKRVLVISPEAAYQYLILRSLEEIWGIEILRAHDFMSGITALTESQPDLVVVETDCRDEGRGLDVVSQIDQLQIPCVVLICHCHPRRPVNTDKRAVITTLYTNLHDTIVKTVREFLSLHN